MSSKKDLYLNSFKRLYCAISPNILTPCTSYKKKYIVMHVIPALLIRSFAVANWPSQAHVAFVVTCTFPCVSVCPFFPCFYLPDCFVGASTNFVDQKKVILAVHNFQTAKRAMHVFGPNSIRIRPFERKSKLRVCSVFRVTSA